MLGVHALGGSAAADRAFTPRFSVNDTGGIAIAAAPLMTCSTSGTNGGACAAARTTSVGPAGSGTLNTLNNNNYTMVEVDTDGDATTTRNSSTATLTVPAGATVLFAGLYWAGDTSAGNNGGVAAPTPASANQAKFKVPDGSYQALTADTIDFGTGGNVTRFQAFKDVTTQVRAAGMGTYAVGDVQLGTGGDRFGGWSLVVAYRDSDQPARNLTVLDGLRTIVSNAPPVTVAVQGFRTPASGSVQTEVGFVAYEGDLGLGGDSVALNGSRLANAANPPTNIFNGSISLLGSAVTARNPSHVNTLGYDADLFEADGALANGATDATIRMATSADQYLPGVLTFTTELLAPDVQLTKTVANLTHPGGPPQAGDVLRFTLTAANTGQDDAAQAVLTDAVPPGTSLVAGSLAITAGAGAPASPSDATGDDRAELNTAANSVVFRVGTGGSAAQGGTLAPSATTTVTFDVRLDSGLAPRRQVGNQALASFVSGTLRSPLGAISNAVSTTVAGPDLTVTKSHFPAFAPGARTVFRAVVSNVGNLASDGSTVTVTDTLPAAAFDSLGDIGGVGWTCSTTGLSFTCTRGDALGAGSSYPPVAVDAIVHAPAPGSIVNTATVAGGGDAVPGNNTGTDVGGAAAQADLQLTTATDPSSAIQGDVVTSTVRMLNRGPSSGAAVTVDAPAPAGLTVLSATSTSGSCTTAVSCAVGTLAPGESADITITSEVTTSATTITSTASATSSTADPHPAGNTSAAAIIVLDSADLRIAESPSSTTPTAPGPLTYTLTVTNDGPGAATGLVIADDLPASFTPTVITPSGVTCNSPAAGGRLTCTAASLASGASATITVGGSLDGSATLRAQRNTATVSAATLDPDPTDNADTSTVQGTPAADVAITAEWVTLSDPAAAISTTAPGDSVRLRLTTENAGPSTTTNVLVFDALPAGVTYVSDDSAECSEGGGTVTCSFPSLAAGASQSVLVTVTVSAGAGSLVSNTATVGATEDDPVSSNDSSTDTFAVAPAADLEVVQTVSSLTAAAGDGVTFTLTATNNGPSAATGVTITEPLPAGLTFLSSATCSHDPTAVGGAPNGTVNCAVGSLAAATSSATSFVGRPTVAAAGGSLTVTASVDGSEIDPEPANDAGAASLAVSAGADLRVTDTASTTSPRVDEDVTYSLVVGNDGPNPATGVVIDHVLPAGAAFVSASPGCLLAGAAVHCDIGTVLPGATATRTVTVRASRSTAGQVLVDGVAVDGAETDPDSADDTAQAPVTVQQQVDLGVTLTPSTPTPTSGTPFTLTLVLGNDGPSSATGTTVTLPIPAGISISAASAGQGTCTVAATEVTCPLGTVAGGGGTQAQFTAVADPSTAGVVAFTASATANQPELRPQNNTRSAQVTLSAPAAGVQEPAGGQPAGGRAILVTRKTSNRAVQQVDRDVVYTITTENRGDAAASDVAITDIFSGPAGVVSATPSIGTCSTRPVVVCRVAQLAPGARVVVEIVARGLTGGTLGNTATAASPDSTVGDGVALATTRIDGRGWLRISQRASRKRAHAGQRFRFTLLLRNPGRTGTARRVKVCDRLPNGLRLRRAPGARILLGEACWTIARLAPGQRRTLRLYVRTGPVAVTRLVTNIASAVASNGKTRHSRRSVTLVAGRG